LKDQILIGRNPVVEAFDSGVELEKVYLNKELRGEVEVTIRKLCKEHEIPLSKVPASKINDMAGNRDHQGVVAFISAVEYQDLENILPFIYEKGETPLILMLDGVSDVRNLGAIARSAYVMGVHSIVFSAKDSARITEYAIKSSAGAILKIPLCRVKNIQESIRYMQSFGVNVIATHLGATETISVVNMSIPIAIIMGSEDKGLRPHIMRLVDTQVIIPQATDFDSLNVSIATGIILYEVVRQRALQQRIFK
jgi:23S rRNA (guanosine2251-2'-O)-methyltransferase